MCFKDVKPAPIHAASVPDLYAYILREEIYQTADEFASGFFFADFARILTDYARLPAACDDAREQVPITGTELVCLKNFCDCCISQNE